MAVAALDQALVHAVVEGHIEGRLHVGVALEAERGLRGLEQVLRSLAGVDAMATDAAYPRLGVGRAQEVGMRTRVAVQALRVHLFGRGLGRIEDLGGVAARRDMRAAGAMAGLAGDPVIAMLQGQLAVRVVGELTGHLIVATRTGFGAHKIRGRGRLGLCGRLGRRGGLRGRRLLAGRGRGQQGNAQDDCAQQPHPSSQSRPSARNRTNQELRDRPVLMH